MGMLDGKIAIITGATSGIGERSAELFIEEGATVVLAGRRAELGEAIAARLGQNASFVSNLDFGSLRKWGFCCGGKWPNDSSGYVT